MRIVLLFIQSVPPGQPATEGGKNSCWPIDNVSDISAFPLVIPEINPIIAFFLNNCLEIENSEMTDFVLDVVKHIAKFLVL